MPFILIYDKNFQIIFAHDGNIIHIFSHTDKFIDLRKIQTIIFSDIFYTLFPMKFNLIQMRNQMSHYIIDLNLKKVNDHFSFYQIM